MSRTALESAKWEMIKAHVIDPDSSPLSPEKQEILERVISAAKVLDKNPIRKHAIAIHRFKYPSISLSQAYEDIRFSTELFENMQTFNYDYWKTWVLNDILKSIQDCRNRGTVDDGKVISAEHGNLIRLIGAKPEDLPDPSRNEKHQFYILINQDNRQVKIDINNLKDLPEAALRELNRAIYGGDEITDSEVEDLLNT